MALVVAAAMCAWSAAANADPSKYPQFAQQKPVDVTPALLSVDQLVNEVTSGKKPLIVDVRTTEEYSEAHILSAISAPLAEFDAHIKAIPNDRLVVLY
jgi:hypothetical protein